MEIPAAGRIRAGLRVRLRHLVLQVLSLDRSGRCAADLNVRLP
jgi:hypothetical protein